MQKENIVKSSKDTFVKTVIYRLYDLIVTTILVSYLFNINTLGKMIEFDIFDLIIGFILYYTFERAWVLFLEDYVLELEKKIKIKLKYIKT